MVTVTLLTERCNIIYIRFQFILYINKIQIYGIIRIYFWTIKVD